MTAGRPAPLQFGLRGLCGLAVGMGLLFGLLHWLDVPPKTGFVLLAVLVVSVVAAVALLVAIAGVGLDGGAGPGEDERGAE